MALNFLSLPTEGACDPETGLCTPSADAAVTEPVAAGEPSPVALVVVPGAAGKPSPAQLAPVPTDNAPMPA